MTSNARVLVRSYDQNGTIVSSKTFEFTSTAGVQTLSIYDQASRIRKVVVEPLDGYVVELGDFEFGVPTQVTTDALGVFQFDALPVGNYNVQIKPFRDIYTYTIAASDKISINYAIGTAVGDLNFGVHLPPTHWVDPTDPLDLTNDNRHSIPDLLRVVNAIRAYGSVDLEKSDVPVDLWVDANQDRRLSILDLLVIVNRINELRRSDLNGEGVAQSGSVSSSVNSSGGLAYAPAQPVFTISPTLEQPLVQSSPAKQTSSVTSMIYAEGETASQPSMQHADDLKNLPSSERIEYLSALDLSLALFGNKNSLDHLSCGCGMCGCC